MQDWSEQRKKILGLGERSVRKSYYPELQKRLDELALFRNLLDHSSDAVFVFLLPQGTLVDCNQTACNYTGISVDDSAAHSIDELFDIHETAVKELLLGKNPQPVSSDSHRADIISEVGNIPVEITIGMYTGKQNRYTVIVARDITDRLRQEEERRHLERQIQHSQRLESLGVLAGGIAHDFNNLLMVVLGKLELVLCDLQPGSPLHNPILEAQQTSLHISELVKQLLAYSGRGEYFLERLDLSASVQEMVQLLQIAVSKKVSLKLELEQDLPPIEIGGSQLSQIILNLITNASEAVGDAPGSIILRTGRQTSLSLDLAATILNETDPSKEYVFIEVVDSGPGIDMPSRQKIFDPFYSTKLSGRGLGLAVVLGIVKGNGGAMTLESSPGHGATFRAILPCATGPALSDQAAEAQTSPAPQFNGETILLVDDNELILTVASDMLARLGLRAVTASNGQQAIEMIKNGCHELRAVLLDLSMPQMDGLAAYQHIKDISPELPIILASGFSEQDVSDQFTDKPIAGFIQKPYSLESLQEALSPILIAD